MNGQDSSTSRHPMYGFGVLDPLPSEEEITKFYQEQYYALIEKGNRAPELQRLMSGGGEAEQESQWLGATLYHDIGVLIRRFSQGQRVLDVGCGSGDLLAYLNKEGFEAEGLEPSSQAAEGAMARGAQVYRGTLEDYVDWHRKTGAEGFHVVTLLNVLEHLPHPDKTIEFVKKVLVTNGVVCVRVPNDFSPLQLAAQKHLNKKPWWIARPDHINYFDFTSLKAFLTRLGFEVIYSQGDFPMEFFLLMGEDYVGAPEIGKECHGKRKRLEMALPSEFRRMLYATLGGIGVGRDCLMLGRLRRQ